MVILGQLKVNTKIEKIQKLRKVKLDERKIIIYVNTEILNNKNEQIFYIHIKTIFKNAYTFKKYIGVL